MPHNKEVTAKETAKRMGRALQADAEQTKRNAKEAGQWASGEAGKLKRRAESWTSHS